MPKHLSSGMGMHKHGTSGRTPPSPRLRHAMALEVNRMSREEENRRSRKKAIQDPKSSVTELFGIQRKKHR